MNPQIGDFNHLFKKFRLRSGFGTLSEFGNALAEQGLVYEDSLFSHWQKGDRIPKNRKIFLIILDIFIKNGGVTSVDDANNLLASAGQGYPTQEENQHINILLKQKQISSDYNGSQFLIEDIENSGNILDYLYELTDLAYEKIYEGYPHVVYNNMKQLIQLIYKLKFHTNTKFQNIISRINWVRARCLSDITKPEGFKIALKQVLKNLDFTREIHSSEIGPSYWMVAAIKRLEIVTRPKQYKISQKEAKECVQLGELSLKYTSKNNYSIRLMNLFELAKTALILKDKNYFDRQMEAAFDCVSNLPKKDKYMETIAWDALARGSLNFGTTAETLKIINLGKRVENKKYRAINLFFKNTQYQTLLSAKDPVYVLLAKKLQTQIKLEASLLNNPYQKIRVRQRKFIGL